MSKTILIKKNSIFFILYQEFNNVQTRKHAMRKRGGIWYHISYVNLKCPDCAICDLLKTIINLTNKLKIMKIISIDKVSKIINKRDWTIDVSIPFCHPYDDYKLDLLIRKRLGQKELIDNEGNILQSTDDNILEHLRFQWNTNDFAENNSILHLFNDFGIFDKSILYIFTYKGGGYVYHKQLNEIEFVQSDISGYSTVKIIKFIILNFSTKIIR